MNRQLTPLAVATLLVVGVGRLDAQPARPAINLITHSQVEIARPAAAIWPSIVDPNKWKAGAALAHHAGPAGKVGEVFAARMSPGAEPAFLVENVELVEARRRTIKLYQPDGRLLGFATWTLTPTGNGTIVSYDVVSETLLPAGAIPPDEITRQEREATETNQRRFDAELLALKKLVESGH